MPANNNPPMSSECFPNQVLEKRFPIFKPTATVTKENTPTESAVNAAFTPLIPAPKPVAIQFIANATPSQIDSCHSSTCR